MKRLTIEVAFDIGETVYLKTDNDNNTWQVLSYVVNTNETKYELFNFTEGSYTAYQFEIEKIV